MNMWLPFARSTQSDYKIDIQADVSVESQTVCEQHSNTLIWQVVLPYQSTLLI